MKDYYSNTVELRGHSREIVDVINLTVALCSDGMLLVADNGYDYCPDYAKAWRDIQIPKWYE